MQYEKYPIKTVGEEAFYSYYTIISKSRKFAKNSKIFRSSKKSTTQVSDIILDACMQYENYRVKTVGEEAFYSYHYTIPLFQNFKNSPKIQK